MKIDALPKCWLEALSDEFEADYFTKLAEFVEKERATTEVFPSEENVFRALELTPLSKVRVLILGQDPYHGDGQAHGLSFSVQPGTKVPPSLRNIFKELQTDLGILPSESGHLEGWAQQGVLLLNTVLTVRAHEANSHQKKGWETFTDKVIQCVNRQDGIAFVLWGKPAQKKRPLIDENKHLIIESAHPSPLSARRGFFGSLPFSMINSFLKQSDRPEIDWRIPEHKEKTEHCSFPAHSEVH